MRYLVTSLAIAWMLSSAAFAQKPPEEKGEKISASGTIKAVAPGRLHVVSEAGDQWYVTIAPQAEVSVTGTAVPSFLRPGMLVKFSGKFNKKAETVEPISTLTVYTPKPDWGKKPQRGGEPDPAAGEFTKGLFKAEEPMEKKPGKPPETFDVSSMGAVVAARGGKVQVRGAEAAFKIELADDAQLALDLIDYRLAKAGDKIDLEGWGNPADKTQVLANRVSIKLVETLGEAKKKPEKSKE